VNVCEKEQDFYGLLALFFIPSFVGIECIAGISWGVLCAGFWIRALDVYGLFYPFSLLLLLVFLSSSLETTFFPLWVSYRAKGGKS